MPSCNSCQLTLSDTACRGEAVSSSVVAELRYALMPLGGAAHGYQARLVMGDCMHPPPCRWLRCHSLALSVPGRSNTADDSHAQ